MTATQVAAVRWFQYPNPRRGFSERFLFLWRFWDNELFSVGVVHQEPFSNRGLPPCFPLVRAARHFAAEQDLPPTSPPSRPACALVSLRFARFISGSLHWNSQS